MLLVILPNWSVVFGLYRLAGSRRATLSNRAAASCVSTATTCFANAAASSSVLPTNPNMRAT